MNKDKEISLSQQKAISQGKGSLAINAAAYANVTVYQYITYQGNNVSAQETIEPSVCPYPGLETFQTSEARFFAGREEDINLLETKLNSHDICGVIAASGAGKSSLVRAGLVPALAERDEEIWDIFAFKPGKNPFYGLARSMSGVLANGNNLDDQLNEIRRNVDNMCNTPGRLSEYIEEVYRRRNGYISGKKHQVLLFVDQWEEIYTRENNGTQDIFVRELMNVVERGLVKLIFTMRIDFMSEMLLTNTDFFRVLKSGIHYVEPMGEIGLRSAIEIPAKEVGLLIPEALTLRLLQDLGRGRDHGSLPYLQFVLRQLWHKRNKDDNSLSTTSYDDMQGLKGAIGEHAESVYQKLSKQEKSLAQNILPRLANISDNFVITSRRMPLEDFDKTAKLLLRKLAEPELRLIVLTSATDDVSETEIVAEIAHEALLYDWKTLYNWIADRKEFYRVRNKLESDAKNWVSNRKRKDFLVPNGKPLLDAQDLKAKSLPGDLSENLIDFIDSSITQENSSKFLKRFAAAAFVGAVTLTSMYLLKLNSDITQNSKEISNQNKSILLNNARLELQRNDLSKSANSLIEYINAEYPIGFDFRRTAHDLLFQAPKKSRHEGKVISLYEDHSIVQNGNEVFLTGPVNEQSEKITVDGVLRCEKGPYCYTNTQVFSKNDLSSIIQIPANKGRLVADNDKVFLLREKMISLLVQGAMTDWNTTEVSIWDSNKEDFKFIGNFDDDFEWNSVSVVSGNTNNFAITGMTNEKLSGLPDNGNGIAVTLFSSFPNQASENQLSGGFHRPSVLAWHPNENILVAADWNVPDPIIYDTQSGQRIGSLSGHYRSVSRISFSKDGNYVATISDNEIRIFNENYKLIRKRSIENSNIVDFDIDEVTSAFCIIWSSGDAIVAELNTGNIILERQESSFFELTGIECENNSLAISGKSENSDHETYYVSYSETRLGEFFSQTPIPKVPANSFIRARGIGHSSDGFVYSTNLNSDFDVISCVSISNSQIDNECKEEFDVVDDSRNFEWQDVIREGEQAPGSIESDTLEFTSSKNRNYVIELSQNLKGNIFGVSFHEKTETFLALGFGGWVAIYSFADPHPIIEVQADFDSTGAGASILQSLNADKGIFAYVERGVLKRINYQINKKGFLKKIGKYQ